MKLILAIVANEDASKVMSNLIKERFFVTKLATTGGFLMAGNTTLLIGTDSESVNKAIEVIGTYSKTRKKLVPNSIPNEFGMFASYPIEVKVGGATIFVIDVERFEKL
ncbi:MAG TPA: cyclic-di-AMP receptor [Bacilli bacterium]|nr:cyclic-di-AMP receptor [Bacilli bacterium]